MLNLRQIALAVASVLSLALIEPLLAGLVFPWAVLLVPNLSFLLAWWFALTLPRITATSRLLTFSAFLSMTPAYLMLLSTIAHAPLYASYGLLPWVFVEYGSAVEAVFSLLLFVSALAVIALTLAYRPNRLMLSFRFWFVLLHSVYWTYSIAVSHSMYSPL